MMHIRPINTVTAFFLCTLYHFLKLLTYFFKRTRVVESVFWTQNR